MIEVVGQAAPDHDLVATVQTYRPDVLLWDLGWNPLSSARLLAELSNGLPPVLALLADGEAVAQVWMADVRGLLPRATSGEALAVALAAVAQGLVILDPALAHLLTAGAGSRSAVTPLEPLTSRELEVLRGLADGVANKEIARRLAISEHTVKFHVNAIMGKLGAQSRTEAVVRATRAGVIML
jgi:DNA-binding NarL/FixJ family response regulator